MVFEKLESIFEIEVQYTTLSCLAIHSGKSSAYSILDQPIVRIGGTPVIPGSSLKGALRSITESLFSKHNIGVCVPEASIPKDIKRSRRVDEYVKKLGRINPCDPSKNGPVCPVCEIFGSASLSGRAIFTDARPTSTILPIKRNHVAITRDTRAQADGSLMEFEAIDKDAEFRGIIRVINPEAWQIGAIISALDTLKMVGLGSKKTAGYGDIDVKIIGITKKDFGKNGWETESLSPEKEAYIQAFSQKLDSKSSTGSTVDTA